MLYLDICTGTQTHSLSGGQIWQKRRGARNLLPLTLLWRSPGLLTTELLQLTPKDDPKDRGAPSHPQTPPSGLQGSICPSGTRCPMRVTEQGVSLWNGGVHILYVKHSSGMCENCPRVLLSWLGLILHFTKTCLIYQATATLRFNAGKRSENREAEKVLSTCNVMCIDWKSSVSKGNLGMYMPKQHMRSQRRKTSIVYLTW